MSLTNPYPPNTPAHSTYEQWLAEAAAVQAKIEAASGLAPYDRAALMQMTGLQQMQAGLQGRSGRLSISKTLDFALICVGQGEAVFQGAPNLGLLNPMGGVHGGWYGTLLDSAMGCAVHTTMPIGRGYTTADYSVSMVRAAKPGVLYRVTGRVLHAGKQLATAEAKLVDAEGKLYAHGQTTCLVFELKQSLKALH